VRDIKIKGKLRGNLEDIADNDQICLYLWKLIFDNSSAYHMSVCDVVL